jgi:hypothetical protein
MPGFLHMPIAQIRLLNPIAFGLMGSFDGAVLRTQEYSFARTVEFCLKKVITVRKKLRSGVNKEVGLLGF